MWKHAAAFACGVALMGYTETPDPRVSPVVVSRAHAQALHSGCQWVGPVLCIQQEGCFEAPVVTGVGRHTYRSFGDKLAGVKLPDYVTFSSRGTDVRMVSVASVRCAVLRLNISDPTSLDPVSPR